jgi:hypothetical protein
LQRELTANTSPLTVAKWFERIRQSQRGNVWREPIGIK